MREAVQQEGGHERIMCFPFSIAINERDASKLITASHKPESKQFSPPFCGLQSRQLAISVPMIRISRNGSHVIGPGHRSDGKSRERQLGRDWQNGAGSMCERDPEKVLDDTEIARLATT